jgi:hypothetical protein
VVAVEEVLEVQLEEPVIIFVLSIRPVSFVVGVGTVLEGFSESVDGVNRFNGIVCIFGYFFE